MRKAGILLPITSLPSDYGIGCFSKEAYEFADFLSESGQTLWQILPLGHTGYGDSPYQAFSAFAGNPYMIDLCTLKDEGLLTDEELKSAPQKENTGKVNYSEQYEKRYPLLRKAYERSNFKENENYKRFYRENEYWLSNYSLFMAVKQNFGGRMWLEWPDDIKYGKSKEEYAKRLEREVDFWNFVQFKFWEEWNSLKVYCNSKGIEIIGDIPIYVSMDSSDVWANPHLFELNDDLSPRFVAGCPPDGFSPQGQLWGNPIYKWGNHIKHGFQWWIQRIKHTLTLCDILRIDHFRGFESYYSIPASSQNAIGGNWEKAPGRELFDAVKNALPHATIIAEDLGFITNEVRELLRHTGFAGIKVLEFAFDKRDGGSSADYLPHNYPANCVAYTGTHDNEPLRAWFDSLDGKAIQKIREYIGDMHAPHDEMYRKLMWELLKSPADTVIIPLWDVLGLGNEARINTPGVADGNWSWRMNKAMLTDEIKNMMRNMTQDSDRSTKNL